MIDVIIQGATKDDLAGVYGEVAEKIGIENAYILFHQFRGQQLTFPLKFYSNECVARKICEEYDAGKNTKELARHFNYSESRIRQILRKRKKKIEDMKQEEL